MIVSEQYADLRDEELLLNIACDEDKDGSFSAFLKRYQVVMQNICRTLVTGNGKFINFDELYYELLAKVYFCQSPPSIPDDSDDDNRVSCILNWLYTIAKNLVIQRLRGNKSLDTEYLNWRPQIVDGDSDNHANIKDESDIREKSIENLSMKELKVVDDYLKMVSQPSEEKKEIRDCVEQLPEKQQIVLWAKLQFYVPGKSHQILSSDILADLEKELGINRVNIRKTYERAKNNIKKCLEDKGFHND